MGRGHALTVLRHRDFALLFIGQLISTLGDQIQSVSIAWQMYVITGSPLQLGLVGAVRATPFIVLSMYGGAIADTFDRRRMLFITQGLSMLIAVWLTVATLTGNVSPLVLYAATFLGGAVQAFDQPTRQALVVNTVPAGELANAFTVNTLLRQVTFLVGPAIAGLLIGGFGLSWSYAANAISFLGLMAAVVLMHPVPVIRPATGSSWEKVAGGLRFALAQPMVLLPLLVDFLTRCVGARRGLLVIFAHDVFKVGPSGSRLAQLRRLVRGRRGRAGARRYRHTARPSGAGDDPGLWHGGPGRPWPRPITELLRGAGSAVRGRRQQRRSGSAAADHRAIDDAG